MIDIDRHIENKIIETYDDMMEEMGIGDCVDEDGYSVEPEMWYWKGVSPEMNEGIDATV